MTIPSIDFIYLGAALATGLIVALIPGKILRSITRPFTMGRFGIRKIRRWHTTTDTLGNVIETLCLIFCVIYPLVPYYTIIFAVLMALTLVCVMARVAIISAKAKKGYATVEIHMVTGLLWVLGITGIMAGTGLLNGQMMVGPIQAFITRVENGSAWSYMYFLKNPEPFFYVLQMFLMGIPLCMLWNQFKHMRLERTWKGANLFTFLVKMVAAIVVLAWCGALGFDFLNMVWHVTPTKV